MMQRLTIASYNINGVNGRLELLLRWLAAARPDILCLQELKAPQQKFPFARLQAEGYEAVWRGQSRWNGVAILSRIGAPVQTRDHLPDDPDPLQGRYIEAAVSGVLIGCVYAPNGNPAPGPKFDYKLRWLDCLAAHAQQLIDLQIPAMLVGDFNIIPRDLDVYKPERWRDDALFRVEVREAYRRLIGQGWVDAMVAKHPNEPFYTFWDYFRNAWGRNAGLRIDHILLSPALASSLRKAWVDREVRGWDGSSDHAPVLIELSHRRPKFAMSGN